MEIPPAPDWFKLERLSPVLSVEINGRRYNCNYGNTSYYVFPKPWDCMNHIYIMEEDGPVYLFNVQEVIDELHHQGFTQVTPPFPSAQDIEVWIAWENRLLEHSLAEGFDGTT